MVQRSEIRNAAALWAGLLLFAGHLTAVMSPQNSEGGLLEKTFGRMKERLEAVQDYRCRYRSRAVWGPRREEIVMKYFFKKPGWIRAEILEGKNKGTILIARGGKVRVRPDGILSIAHFTFPADSPRVTDIRGNKLEETSWPFFVEEHLKSLEVMDLVSERRDALDGTDVLVLEIVSRDPSRTRRIAREILWVSAEDFILLQAEMYDAKERLVQHIRYTDILLNPGLPDSLFVRFSRK